MNRHTLSLALFCSLLAATPHASVAQETTATTPAVPVASTTLDGYVGTYRVSRDLALRVRRIDDTLHLQATGQAEWPLAPESETVFRVHGMDARVTFGFNAMGETDHLVLHEGGRDTKAIRE